MALSDQKACYPGSLTTLADMTVLGGGMRVTLLNTHATEPVVIGGNENEDTDWQKQGGSTLSSSTGFRLAAGGTLSVVLNQGEVLYGRSVTSTVTATVAIFRSNYPAI